MALRTIIEIDQDLCDGCGACETGCPEGALRVIDGKARLVGESLCDGLGACIGHCPRGAIRVLTREAAAYDEKAVLAEILPQGEGTLKAHLEHLDHHGQDLYLRQAVEELEAKGVAVPEPFGRFSRQNKPVFVKSCAPAVRPAPLQATPSGAAGKTFPAAPGGASTLRNWPVQLHLINPRAPQFEDADVLIAADCTAFSLGSFHADLLDGRTLAIACPKLDSGREIYASKLAAIVAKAKTVQVVIMEVPCCSGLLRLVQDAREAAGSTAPIEALVLGIDGGFVARKAL